MNARMSWMSGLAVAVLVAVSAPPTARAASVGGTWDIDFEVEVQKKNGTSRTFDGVFTFDGDALSGVGKEVLRLNNGLESASFTYGKKTCTPANAKAARAKFNDGELVGLVFQFNKGQKKFRIRLDDFLANKAVRGGVVYDDLAYATALGIVHGGSGTVGGDPLAAPTPSAVAGGLALMSAVFFRRRGKDSDPSH